MIQSKLNKEADLNALVERQWAAIEALFESGRTDMIGLSRAWNKPLHTLQRWQEEKRPLPNHFSNNLVLRYGVSPLYLWLGEGDKLIDPEDLQHD